MAIRSGVPSATKSRTSTSGSVFAAISELGGTHRAGSASSRGASAHPTEVPSCASARTAPPARIATTREKIKTCRMKRPPAISYRTRWERKNEQPSWPAAGRLELTRKHRNPVGDARETYLFTLRQRRVFGKYTVERRDKQLRVRLGKNERRPQLQHIVMRSVRSRQNPAFAQPVHHVGGLRGRRRARLAVHHQIHSEKVPRSPHVADQRMFLPQRCQPLQQELASPQRVFLQTLLFQHVQHRQSRPACHWIPTERAEKLHPVRERRRNLARRHNRSQRRTVPNRLSQHHHVRHRFLHFKPPEVRSQPPESRLHFIRYANPSRRAHVAVRLLQISGRKHNLSRHARQRFREKRARPSPFLPHRFDQFRNVPRVFPPGVAIFPPVRATVIVRNRRHMHPRLSSASSRPVEFVRADVDQRVRVPMVGMLQNDHVLALRMRARQPQRQLVRLASRIQEVADPQRLRQQPRQPPAYFSTLSCRYRVFVFSRAISSCTARTTRG